MRSFDFNARMELVPVSSTVSSAAILTCVFIGKSESVDKVIRIVFPLVFWLGLLAEQFLIWSANTIRKKREAKSKFRRMKDNVGVLSILQTKPGAVADIVLLISTIVFLVLLLCNAGEGFAQYLFIFLIVLSFRLHCVFNGKNYKYKKYLAKRKVDKDVY